MLFNFVIIVLYAWGVMTSRLMYIFGLTQFFRSENIFLNFTPIYCGGAFLWAIILTTIKLYYKDRRHYKLDLTIILLIIYAYFAYHPFAIVWKPTFFEMLALIFTPFISWIGTLTWAIILTIYRIHLIEQERLKLK